MIDQLPSDAPWVALDTETSGLHPDDGARVACVAVTWPSDASRSPQLHTVALPFDQGERDKIEYAPISLFAQTDPNLDERDWRTFLNWCMSQRLVFHNAKYDLTMMRAGTRHWEGRDLQSSFYWDTMLVQSIMDPIEDVGLDKTALRLGLGQGKQGVEGLKGWLKQHKYPTGRYDLVPWEIVETYVKTDTELTAQLFLDQQERLLPYATDHPLWDRIKREYRLMRALLAMESRGILYDGEKSIAAAEMLEQRAAEINDQLPFDGYNINAAKHYFFEQCGLLPDRVTDKGSPTLDEEQTRAWTVDGVEWAREYAQMTRALRAVSMWYRGYAEKIGTDGRLRCNFKQTKVKSGRMSVDRVNLQAMPKADKYSAVGQSERLAIYRDVPGVRELLGAADGKGLWSLDLSQAELRVAAKYSQCEVMLKLLLEGADFHGETCRAVLHTEPVSPDWKARRDIAKRVNFSGIFMVGAETLRATLAKAADIHLELAECEDIIRGWRQLYPEIAVIHRRAERFFDSNGYVRILANTPYETKSWLGPRDDPRTGWSRMVQGSLAEAFKLLTFGVEEKWPGNLILTVHDSTVLEMSLDEGDHIAQQVALWGGELMTELFGIEMKIDIDRWA